MDTKTDTKQDIVQQQQQEIKELREQLEQKDRHINYLEYVKEEYDELKTAFGHNGNLTYYQAYQSIQTRQNAEAKVERDRINAERQAQRELIAAEIHDAEVKEVLNEFPGIEKYCNDQKQKAKDTKEKMQSLATRFYDMTPEQVKSYIEIPHKNDESAVKHLLLLHITNHQDADGSYVTHEFECEVCGDMSNNLGEFESHVYLHSRDHKNANLLNIEDEARTTIAKVHKQYLQDIEHAIRAKKDRNIRAQQAKHRAEQQRLKQSLPYAK